MQDPSAFRSFISYHFLISRILEFGIISQPMAAMIAGKLSFVTSWVFRVGKALLKLLYSHQHELRGCVRLALLESQGILPLLKSVQIAVGSQFVSIL